MTHFLLLDFDNTMMGTEQHALPSLIDRFNALYGDKTDHALTLEEFKQNFHGQAREGLCSNLSKHFNIAVSYPELYDSREWRMMQHMQTVKGGIPMAKNIIEALHEIKAENVVIGFVSNNPIQRAMAAMRYADNGRGDALAAIFGTRYFEAGDIQKPLPDVYLRAMEQLGATPENTFAVEDSASGVKSALAAGITTFGYTEFIGNHEAAEKKLNDMGCIASFNDWAKFPALFRAQTCTPASSVPARRARMTHG